MGIESLIGAGVGLVGSALQSDAAGDAADAQIAASERATALQKEQYDATVERNKPFVQGGTTAFNALLDRLGLTGNTSAQGYGSFGKVPTAADVMAEPGYQFGLDQGQQAINRSLNARGMTNSGAQIKAAARFGTDYAGTQYGNAFNRNQSAQQQQYNQFANVANMGQNAANNTGQAGANYATQAGANMIGAGNARAAGELAQGNIWANALNQGVSAYNRSRPPAISGDYSSMATPDWTGVNGGFGYKGGTGGF
jgi:hypothetical protein